MIGSITPCSSMRRRTSRPTLPLEACKSSASGTDLHVDSLAGVASNP